MNEPDLREARQIRATFNALFGIFEDLFTWFFGSRAEHLERGRHSFLVRCFFVVTGTAADFIVLAIYGSAFAGYEYVNAFVENSWKDNVWLACYVVFLVFDVAVGWSKRRGTVLGHMVRGVAAPFVLVTLVLVLTALVTMLLNLVFWLMPDKA